MDCKMGTNQTSAEECGNMDKRAEDIGGFISGLSGRIKRGLAGNADGVGRQRIKDAAARYASPAALALLSFVSSGASPALGAHPFGPALLCAAPTFTSATAVLAGMIASSFRLGAGCLPFIICAVGIYAFRLGAGLCGVAETSPLKEGGLFGLPPGVFREKIDDVRFLRLETSFNSGTKIKVFTCFAASVLLGISNILIGTNLWYDVFGTVLGAALSPVLCIAFSALSDPSAHPTLKRAGEGAVLFALTLSLSGVSVGGIRVALVAGVAASLFAGQMHGVGEGALIGVFAGFGMEPALFAVFPIAAMCQGAIGAYSVGVGATVSVVLGMSWALFADGISAVSTALPELLISAVIFYPVARFAPLPANKMKACASSFGEREKERSGGEALAGRIRQISDAMERMSEVFFNLAARLKTPSLSDGASICAEEFEKRCASCRKREICHKKENMDGVVRAAGEVLIRNGALTLGDVPRSMARGCPSIDEILEGAGQAFGRFVEETFVKDRTSVIARDYSSISRMISKSIDGAKAESDKNEELSSALAKRLSDEGISFESLGVYGVRRPRVYIRGFRVKDLTCGADDLQKIAEEAIGAPLTEPEMSLDYDRLNMYAECRRRFSVKYGSYGCAGSSREACGDSVVSFTGKDDDRYILICDGMGSGREAALTSRAAATFLEKMIGAGCPEPSAFEMLNDFTRERRIECFSTVDLLKIDPYSGEASFFKSGGAPSFVMRNGKLFRIECESAPLGIIGHVSAKSVSFKVAEGDRIVMMSDGITPDGDDGAWFYDYLSDTRHFSGDLPEAARRLATAGVERRSRPDDATVGVIRIDAA